MTIRGKSLSLAETLAVMRSEYIKMGYHFVGIQAVVKPCHWLRRSLLSKGQKFCYKQLWYGIPSHRCLQMSPVLVCNLQCVYCWRAHEIDIGLTPISPEVFEKLPYDEPEEIVRNSLEEWYNILIGYRGNPAVDPLMLEEALRPIHVTFSLTGEPTIYPKLGELVEAYFNAGFKSVFIVTNGTYPERLASLEREPSQLYVTVPAPDERTFIKVTRPLVKDAWKRLLETLELLKSFKCPTVMRLTLVKGWNLIKPEEYAKLVVKYEPTYVEAKAAMSVGYFRERLSKENMPRHEDIVKFAEKLSEECGYKIIGEYMPSRVVLLSKLDKPIKIIQ